MTTATAPTSAVNAPRATGLRARLARHPAVLLWAFGAASALAAWLRLPAVARDTLWAEDGRNFLQDAINSGPLGALFLPYAGYLHTIPRLIASGVVGILPVSGWALGMTAASCAVAGVVTVTVFVASRGIIGWMPARLAIASLTVLAPLAPREVLGNAANLHSLLLWALFWIALSRPRTRTSAIGLSVVALLGALTEVQSLFLLPLLLFRFRDRRRWLPRGMLLLGAVAQLVVAVVFPRGTTGNPADDPLSVAYGYVINAVLPWMLSAKSIGPFLMTAGPAVGFLLLIPVAVAGLLTLRRGTGSQRVTVVALTVGSAFIFGASVVANPNTFYDYADMTSQQLGDAWLARYGVVPSMMLAAVVLTGLSVAVQGRVRTESPRLRPAVLLLSIVTILLSVSAVVHFVPDSTRRSWGPEWQPQLAAATESCLSLPDSSRILLNETIGWQVAVPCHFLRR